MLCPGYWMGQLKFQSIQFSCVDCLVKLGHLLSAWFCQLFMKQKHSTQLLWLKLFHENAKPPEARIGTLRSTLCVLIQCMFLLVISSLAQHTSISATWWLVHTQYDTVCILNTCLRFFCAYGLSPFPSLLFQIGPVCETKCATHQQHCSGKVRDGVCSLAPLYLDTDILV